MKQTKPTKQKLVAQVHKAHCYNFFNKEFYLVGLFDEVTSRIRKGKRKINVVCMPDTSRVFNLSQEFSSSKESETN